MRNILWFLREDLTVDCATTLLWKHCDVILECNGGCPKNGVLINGFPVSCQMGGTRPLLSMGFPIR